jgi:signal transduction histidine kinase
MFRRSPPSMADEGAAADVRLTMALRDTPGKPGNTPGKKPGAGQAPITVVICVEDRGPGVPPDQRERIFEPFYRLPGASEREGGVGLGLSLVKTIAERHGGHVRCEAREGGGARFVVELPL